MNYLSRSVGPEEDNDEQEVEMGIKDTFRNGTRQAAKSL